MTTHELCRFRAGFAGLPKTKPAKFRGIFNTPEKPYKAMLGLGHSKVYDLIRQEGLPTVKFGAAIRVPAEELKQWVKQRIA
jgi:excisionase family DNA binding protein